MSTSMVSTVLEIEREAERILTQAGQDKDRLLAEAKEQRAAATRGIEDAVMAQVADLERADNHDRDAKGKELVATGEAALSAVKNISPAAYEAGVGHILKALAGK